MCQIFGMNARTPTDFQFSFKGFTKRGGATDVHADGWGLALYKGRGIQAFHEMAPSCTSPLATLLQTLPIKTHNIIAHIRYATVGSTVLENVHPFTRELWGRNWAFAHNGDLPHFALPEGGRPVLGKGSTVDSPPPPPLERLSPKTSRNVTAAGRHFNPVGATDSEAVFVEILNAIDARFDIRDGMPSSCELFEFLKSLTDEIIEGGKAHAATLGSKEQDYQPIFNFLLCCGEGLQFAFCYPGKRPNSTTWNSLHYIVRRHPFKKASLVDVDYDINFKDVTEEGDQCCVIATKPLTVDECWIEMKKGELLMFEYGQPFGKKCHQVKEDEEEERSGLDANPSWDIDDVEEVDRTCGRIEFDSPKRKDLRNIRSSGLGGQMEPLKLSD
ncbi:hypothetical protein TrVE_jg12044 [Triparma verrucosa]|uniref:Glutamine amidotransferase type-2 domain-containing protein n=1 Tax=Triparma verrucosa TaxID=1606542 RepID=A0A9W7F4U9_9STRA|nr:hypothetical protein TrVE_jg12044 [Triparma verrucosa]